MPGAAPANPATSGAVSAPVGPAKSVPARPEEGPPPIGQIERLKGNSVISSVLSAPVAAPSLQKPQVSKITGGRLIQRVEPIYPSAAMGIIGEVTLKAIVGKDGRVKSVKVVRGHAVLAQAAAVAIRRWRYEPFVLNGVPIEVENTIVVNFKNSR
jgi:protein TonB